MNSYFSSIRFHIECFLSFDIMSIGFHFLFPSVFFIKVGECCRNFLQGHKTSLVAIGIFIFWNNRFSDHLASGLLTNNIYNRNSKVTLTECILFLAVLIKQQGALAPLPPQLPKNNINDLTCPSSPSLFYMHQNQGKNMLYYTCSFSLFLEKFECTTIFLLNHREIIINQVRLDILGKDSCQKCATAHRHSGSRRSEHPSIFCYALFANSFR